MGCPISVSMLFGFDGSTGANQNAPIRGFATNIAVSSTAITIPMLGVGLSSSGTYRGSAFSSSDFQILAEGLPSGIGNLYVSVKDVTTNQSVGPATLSSSTDYVNFSAGLSGSVSSGDQLVLVISSDNPGVVPSISWRFV